MLSPLSLPRLWALRRDENFRKALDGRLPIAKSFSRPELASLESAQSQGSFSRIPTNVSTALVTVPNRTKAVPFAYEIHGTGPIKLVFFAGLGADSKIWHKQLSSFASQGDFSILTFDAWGVGFSSLLPTTDDKDDVPLTTRVMAEDVAHFLDSIGWHSFHAVGSSLGGMILMQLCLVAQPTLDIRSATFVSTSSGLSIPRLHVLYNILRHRGSAKTIEDECRMMMFLNHPPSYLEAPSATNPNRRNLDVLASHWFHRKKTVPRTPPGRLAAHAAAGARHWVSRDRLKKIAARLDNGHNALVIAGSHDQIINPRNSVFLARTFGPDAKLAVLRGGGHSIQDQFPEEFNELLENHVRAVEARRLEHAGEEETVALTN